MIECCNHAFCFECIKRWSETENTCPMCKKRFNAIKRKLFIQPKNILKKNTNKLLDDEETIEIPDTNQVSEINAGFDAPELINLLVLAREAQRLTLTGRILEQIAILNSISDNIVHQNNRLEDLIDIDNFIDFPDSQDDNA